MAMRVNAGLGMARITERVHQIAMSHQPNAVGAVGQVKVFPNSRNVIPGKVIFTVDIRSPEQGKLDLMRGEVERAAHAVAAELGLGIAIEAVGHFDPVTFDPALVKTVRGAAERLRAARPRPGGRGHRPPRRRGAGHVPEIRAGRLPFRAHRGGGCAAGR